MNLFKRFFVKRKLYDDLIKDLIMTETNIQALLQDIKELKKERYNTLKDLDSVDRGYNRLKIDFDNINKELSQKNKELYNNSEMIEKLYIENQTALRLLYDQSHVSDNISKCVDEYWIVSSEYEIVKRYNYKVTLVHYGYHLNEEKLDNEVLYKGKNQNAKHF